MADDAMRKRDNLKKKGKQKAVKPPAPAGVRLNIRQIINPQRSEYGGHGYVLWLAESGDHHAIVSDIEGRVIHIPNVSLLRDHIPAYPWGIRVPADVSPCGLRFDLPPIIPVPSVESPDFLVTQLRRVLGRFVNGAIYHADEELHARELFDRLAENDEYQRTSKAS